MNRFVSNDIIIAAHIFPCVLYVGMDGSSTAVGGSSQSRVNGHRKLKIRRLDDNNKDGDRGRDSDKVSARGQCLR